MSEMFVLIPGIVILLGIITIFILSTSKKNKNIPLVGIERLFLSSCEVTIEVIPDEVNDILKFSTGEYALKNFSKIDWKEILINQKNNVFEHILIEFPSNEHEEFKNNLMIYGKCISKEKFGPLAFVFTSLPKISFKSKKCNQIYSFIKKHIQENERVLVKINYSNTTQKSLQFMING